MRDIVVATDTDNMTSILHTPRLKKEQKETKTTLITAKETE